MTGIHKTAKCFDPIGTVDNWIRIPTGRPEDIRMVSHLTSQLSVDLLMELFRVIVGDPKGLDIKEATPTGLGDRVHCDPWTVFEDVARDDFDFFMRYTFDVS